MRRNASCAPLKFHAPISNRARMNRNASLSLSQQTVSFRFRAIHVRRSSGTDLQRFARDVLAGNRIFIPDLIRFRGSVIPRAESAPPGINDSTFRSVFPVFFPLEDGLDCKSRRGLTSQPFLDFPSLSFWIEIFAHKLDFLGFIGADITDCIRTRPLRLFIRELFIIASRA